jgi:Na+-translocating ferredoxin:NAD+ oxidoreductase subunit B
VPPTTRDAGRDERIRTHTRDPRWARPPRRVVASACVACDLCAAACPPSLGAVVRRGVAVRVVPELCNGCGRCVPACPVDCLVEDPSWEPSTDGMWSWVVVPAAEWQPDAVAVAGGPTGVTA